MAKKDALKDVAPGTAGLSEEHKIVVVDEDTEHDGVGYKAGVYDLPAGVAGALLDAEKAHGATGRGKGR